MDGQLPMRLFDESLGGEIQARSHFSLVWITFLIK